MILLLNSLRLGFLMSIWILNLFKIQKQDM